MKHITLFEKPLVGAMDRVCHVCGDNYFGWNFVACPTCENAKNYTVTRVW